MQFHRACGCGSSIGNFAVTFTIISVLTGLTTTFNTGLTYGGPLTMVYGWPIVGMLTLVVGLAMAEICSAYPTSGGLYFWSAKLCGNEWGPFASWLTGWYVASPWLPFLGIYMMIPCAQLHAYSLTDVSKVQPFCFTSFDFMLAWMMDPTIFFFS